MSIIYNIKKISLKYKKAFVDTKDIAKIYDNLSKVHSSSKSNYFSENYRTILSYTNLNKSSRVLEIGCGDGSFSKVIPEECKYLGIDVSNKMISEALKNNTKNPKNISFEKVDAKEFIKYSSKNTYDLIVFPFSWKYFNQEFHENILNILKKDGQIIIIDDFNSNFSDLYKNYEEFKINNKKDLRKINPFNYYPNNTDEFDFKLNHLGYVQSFFLKLEKNFSNEKDFLITSGIIPELISEFGSASELYSKKFIDFLKEKKYSLPEQRYFICIAKK